MVYLYLLATLLFVFGIKRLTSVKTCAAGNRLSEAGMAVEVFEQHDYAELLAANSVYDFFIDLLEVQRAANRFDFFLNPAERGLWYERLEEYFQRSAAGSPREQSQ